MSQHLCEAWCLQLPAEPAGCLTPASTNIVKALANAAPGILYLPLQRVSRPFQSPLNPLRNSFFLFLFCLLGPLKRACRCRKRFQFIDLGWHISGLGFNIRSQQSFCDFISLYSASFYSGQLVGAVLTEITQDVREHLLSVWPKRQQSARHWLSGLRYQ